jgi:hypothetical protein
MNSIQRLLGEEFLKNNNETFKIAVFEIIDAAFLL